MNTTPKNPLLLGLAVVSFLALTIVGKAKLHGFGLATDAGSQTLSVIIGLVAIAVFCAALYYIKWP